MCSVLVLLGAFMSEWVGWSLISHGWWWR